MRIIDSETQTDLVGEPDLEAGYVNESLWASPEVYETIDNITKFALDDDDFETVQIYTRYTEEELKMRNTPNPQSVTDAAICELYEMMEAAQNG